MELLRANIRLLYEELRHKEFEYAIRFFLIIYGPDFHILSFSLSLLVNFLKICNLDKQLSNSGLIYNMGKPVAIIRIFA